MLSPFFYRMDGNYHNDWMKNKKCSSRLFLITTVTEKKILFFPFFFRKEEVVGKKFEKVVSFSGNSLECSFKELVHFRRKLFVNCELFTSYLVYY
jgi:hypothetical protein